VGPGVGDGPAGRGAATLNSLYFGIGVTIILALVVALVGPLFVDWTAYRAAFENQATEMLGRPVKVTGAADATLLPVPRLVFEGVTIGDDAGAPLMTVGRFEVEVELFPLLSGTVQVTRMQLDRPEVTVRVGADGTVDWTSGGAALAIDPAKVAFDRIEVTGGSVRIEDERRPLPVELRDVNAHIEARSLHGPFRFDGGMTVDGEPVMMRLATGTRDPDGTIVVKATLTPASHPVELAFDGIARVVDGRPEWSGGATVARVIAEGEDALPWRVRADLDVDADRLRARTLEFQYGPEDRPFSITGAATVDLAGDPAFDAVLSSRQIDLDRTLGAGPDEPVAFDRALAALSGTLSALPRPPIDGRVGFDIPGIVVGGGLVQDVRLDLVTAPDGWTVETLAAALPGRSALSASGVVTVSPSPAFDGAAKLSSEQPATLVAWWAPGSARAALDPFDVAAGVEASAAAVNLSRVVARLGTATIEGDVAFVPAGSGRPANLTLGLSADSVAVEQVSAITGLFAGTAGGEGSPADVVLRLSADAVTAGGTSADGVEVVASLVGGTLDVERFFVRDLAGARLSAEGSVRDVLTTPDGSLQVRASAEQLEGLAGVVGRLAPGSAAARMLGNAAPVLVPASLEATVNAARVADGTNASVAVTGTAGGSSVDTRIAFSGRVDRWREASVDVALDLAGPSGIRLMRQLGFDVPEVEGAGLGSLKGSVHGIPAERLDLDLSGALGGTSVGLTGRARLPETEPATASLDVTLKSDDVGPILALGGDVFAGVLDRTPVDLTAVAEISGAKVRFSGLSGTVSGGPVSGMLTLDTGPEVPTVRGDLALGEVGLDRLLELALGGNTMAMPFETSANPWPEAPFGPTVLDAIDADVAVRLERVPTGVEGLVLAPLSTAVRSSASGIAFDQIDAGLAGGRLGGSLVVKRDLEGQAAVSATLSLADAAVDAIAWRRDDRPVVTGRLSLDVEADATGRTVQGLVSTLAGGGTVHLVDGEIRSMTPQAFSAVLRAADGGQELADDRIRDLFTANLDAADLPFERVEGSFTIASGVVRSPSLVVSGSGATTAGSATVDLSKWTLESDWTLAVAPGDVAAAAGTTPPEVDILFRGPVDAPGRRVDVTAFSSFLGIRAFERETERVLVLQADILERELLSRSVLRHKEDGDRRRRDAEDARRRAEAEEAARRAEEEARRVLEESGPAGDLPVEQPLDLTPPGVEPLPDDPLDSAAPPGDPASAGEGGDFADTIGRRLQLLEEQEDMLEAQQPGEPVLILPRPLTDAPDATIEMAPLPPPVDGALPGVRIPPPLPGG
jgi:hypothetical protein